MKFNRSTKIYPVGTMFGWIEIIGEPIVEKNLIKENCRCTICGKELFITRHGLTGGMTKTCGGKGCRKYAVGEKHRERLTTHGLSGSRFYNIYCGAKARCEKPSSIVYHLYGGKGIKFLWKGFEDFKNDMYESYLEHVKQYGEKDTTIERIDSNKHYCKENCKRATCKEQANNISKNRKVEYNGRTYNSISTMCDELGLKYSLILRRLNNGWTVKEAVETKGLKKRLHDKRRKECYYNGKTYYSIMELARDIGMSYKLISYRMGKGMSVEDAVLTPKKFNVKKV